MSSQVEIQAIGEQLRAAIEGGGYNTKALREVAESLFFLRQTHTDAEGRPDMTGRSYAYRQDLGDIMRVAGVTPTNRSKVAAVLRYHMSSVLRERLSDEELESYGLSAETQLDRARSQRKRKARMTRLLRPGEKITRVEDLIGALSGLRHLLSNTDLEAVISDARGDEVAKLRHAFVTLERKLHTIAGAIPPPTPDD